MSQSTRRNFLRLGAGTAIAALMGAEERPALSATSEFSAGSYAGERLRGFAIDTIRSRGRDEGYFDALASTGANVARLQFRFEWNGERDGFHMRDEDAEALVRILGWTDARGIGLIVAAVIDDRVSESLWTSNAQQDAVVSCWGWLARTIGNHHSLAGLDLMNEPNPPREDGTLSSSQERWNLLARRIVKTIREAGIAKPVIVESVGGGQAIGFRGLQPLNDPSIVYSLHVYTPHAITHQRVAPQWTMAVPYPAGPEWKLRDAVTGPGGWDKTTLGHALTDVIDFQQRTNLPIYVGEFSCVRWAPNGSATRYVEDCLAIFRQYGWSWCYHEFRGWPGWDAEIASEDPRVLRRAPTSPTYTVLRQAMR